MADNNINLKMLGMFVSKCGISAARSTSVSGGQEAIEAFKAFEGSNKTTKGFGIVLMDLSMSEVSGFDATSTIRQIEKASGYGHRAFIVAPTGLVSDKDRSAVYEAGVDDYVTKPAGLQKVRNIIETWQRRRHDSVSSVDDVRSRLIYSFSPGKGRRDTCTMALQKTRWVPYGDRLIPGTDKRMLVEPADKLTT
jgi:CheY-like chemotaxis protein